MEHYCAIGKFNPFELKFDLWCFFHQTTAGKRVIGQSLNPRLAKSRT